MTVFVKIIDKGKRREEDTRCFPLFFMGSETMQLPEVPVTDARTAALKKIGAGIVKEYEGQPPTKEAITLLIDTPKDLGIGGAEVWDAKDWMRLQGRKKKKIAGQIFICLNNVATLSETQPNKIIAAGTAEMNAMPAAEDAQKGAFGDEDILGLLGKFDPKKFVSSHAGDEDQPAPPAAHATNSLAAARKQPAAPPKGNPTLSSSASAQAIWDRKEAHRKEERRKERNK